MKPPRVLLFSRFNTSPIASLLRKNKITITAHDPDIIICLGGDGTLLLAETTHPGIPKLLVRRSKVGNKGYAITPKELVQVLSAPQSIKTINEMKLQATIIKGRKRMTLPIALNDIIIRNKDQTFALRFSIKVDGKMIAKQVIGDGVVIATPFGSTGYFESITRKKFKKGIGVAFNNSTVPMKEIIAKEDTKIEMRIDREGGLISSDVSKPVGLSTGDKIIITKAKQHARLILPRSHQHSSS